MPNLRDITRNFATAVREPRHIFNCISYHISKLLHNGNAFLRISPDVKIGFFLNYSEYASMKDNIEPGELAFLEEYPLPDGDIIDIGANIGTISILLARRYPSRNIHSFEPNPHTLTALNNNIRMNSCTNIAVAPIAASDKTGTVSFLYNNGSRATARLHPEGSAASLQVRTISIDEYCLERNITTVAFLKIDVEGHEAQVLNGAARILTSARPPTVYYEVCPGCCDMTNTDPMAATNLLINNGYIIHTLSTHGKLIQLDSPDVNGLVFANWVAIHPRNFQRIVCNGTGHSLQFSSKS